MTKLSVGAALVGADLMTPTQASETLKVPEKTLAVWRSTNRVKLAYCKIGGAVRYRRTDLEAFILAGLRNADSRASR